MTTKNENITYAIRSIKALLKSKMKHAKITNLVESFNKKELAKYRAANPEVESWEVSYKCKDTLPYPKWVEGCSGLTTKFAHQKYYKKVALRTTTTFDYGFNSDYITALHIAYCRLRDSQKQHTGDDSVWIEKNKWAYQAVCQQLSQEFNLPESAFEACNVQCESASHDG